MLIMKLKINKEKLKLINKIKIKVIKESKN